MQSLLDQAQPFSMQHVTWSGFDEHIGAPPPPIGGAGNTQQYRSLQFPGVHTLLGANVIPPGHDVPGGYPSEQVVS